MDMSEDIESNANVESNENVESNAIVESNGNIEEDGFVVLEKDDNLKYASNRGTFFSQMEAFLASQVDKCDYYKRVFEQQSNETMANKFAAYSLSTAKSLELLKMSWQNNEILPKYKFEHVNFNCVPVNMDVKEKELQLVVRTSNLPVSAGKGETYIIAEFAFTKPRDDTISGLISSWLYHIKIEPKNVFNCSSDDVRQLDIVYSTNSVSFTNPDDEFTEYTRPISFFVDKGKSRTLKRKFKPIKLTFYEKTNFFRCDRKLGVIQVKVDAINDDATLVTKLPIMDGRKQTKAMADVRVKVREPLVGKTVRAHEEKLVLLT